MSGTFPTTAGFSASQIKSKQSVFVDYTQSGKRQVRKTGGQAWAFSIRLPRLEVNEWREVLAFLLLQESQYGAFEIVHPLFAVPKGVATGTPLVVGASQTGTTLNTDGWTASTVNIMKQGDLFKIAGNNKVYMCTQASDADGAGASSLTFMPPLVESPADNAALTVLSVPFTVMLSDESPPLSLVPPERGEFSFDVVEVLS